MMLQDDLAHFLELVVIGDLQKGEAVLRVQPDQCAFFGRRMVSPTRALRSSSSAHQGR